MSKGYMEKVKEYGGYLPFELNMKGGGYFRDVPEENIVRLNCGRTAFWYAFEHIRPVKVYVPYLNCLYATKPIEDLGIPYEFYYLNDSLLPQNIEPKKNEAVLWINYYGNASREQISKVTDLMRYTSVIIDNCHAFFSKPVLGVYNCYSARKFFGVCDGAYLIKEGISRIELETDFSAEYIGFLLECIEKGTNTCYSKNLDNEKRLENSYKGMSVLTRKILQTIDYEEIKMIRNRNFRILHEAIGEYNQFSVNLKSDTHIYYPLLIFSDKIRQRLISRKIYTPTWWRHVPDYFDNSKNIETVLSKYMLLLPVDQRYTSADMRDIADIVREEIKKL